MRGFGTLDGERREREESFNSQMGEICLNRAIFRLEYQY